MRRQGRLPSGLHHKITYFTSRKDGTRSVPKSMTPLGGAQVPEPRQQSKSEQETTSTCSTSSPTTLASVFFSLVSSSVQLPRRTRSLGQRHHRILHDRQGAKGPYTPSLRRAMQKYLTRIRRLCFFATIIHHPLYSHQVAHYA